MCSQSSQSGHIVGPVIPDIIAARFAPVYVEEASEVLSTEWSLLVQWVFDELQIFGLLLRSP